MSLHNGYSSNFLEYYMVIHLHLENSILYSTLWDKRIWKKWKMWYQFLKFIEIWKYLSFETKIVKENTQFSEMVLICFKKQQCQQVLPTSCSFVIKGFFFFKIWRNSNLFNVNFIKLLNIKNIDHIMFSFHQHLQIAYSIIYNIFSNL